MWPLYCSLDIDESALLCMFMTGDSSTTGAIMRGEIKRKYGCREVISQAGLGETRLAEAIRWTSETAPRGRETTMTDELATSVHDSRGE